VPVADRLGDDLAIGVDDHTLGRRSVARGQLELVQVLLGPLRLRVQVLDDRPATDLALTPGRCRIGTRDPISRDLVRGTSSPWLCSTTVADSESRLLLRLAVLLHLVDALLVVAHHL